MPKVTVLDVEMPTWQMVQGSVRRWFVRGPIPITRGRYRTGEAVAVFRGKTYIGPAAAVEIAVDQARRAA